MGITTSCFHNLNEVKKRESIGECSSGGVEEVIERSKVHSSILDEVDVGEGEVAEVSNVEEFLTLQSHPTWGGFFQTFGYDLGGQYKRLCELVMGKKFAEGGQAELYDCKVKLWYPEANDRAAELGMEYVIKILKKGTYLKQLKSQLPQGLLQSHVADMERLKSPTNVKILLCCNVLRGILLKDGRFAFLMEKEDCDLRHLIDKNLRLRSGKHRRPFSKEEVELVMYDVALGVEWLHGYDIVHRDLKASNVLVKEFESGWMKRICYVADYECSVGVVGTGFFRAPEILQACKEHMLSERPEVFSKEADIDGYGMTCYEILTGKLPFKDRPSNDYDQIISGQRPLLPKHIEGWIHELLDKCWQLNLAARPCIGEILNVILEHSAHARRREEFHKNKFGKNYRGIS